MKLQKVRPAPGRLVRMHDRGYRQAFAEETVDAEDPHYARLIRDGDLIPIDGTPDEPAPVPAPATPAGHRRGK